ncbi:receptor-type tyrosine-protein phosphatase H-like isoform X2 [Girardinichthys multiradiatus]|uniref:receptor-type tyrosine-protein phosphatase H-like isoform X2 n=1 Tax=Girardinichthys multiradiatus TaxID=208333 RepID=UPI001FADFE0C|nr:receptor-type tyrosine-protein phosphatase H-like isoform X2 [Girardinichthys multiradiatus]
MQLSIMRCLFFKSTTDQLLLCVFSGLLWVVTNCNKMELNMTNTAESKTIKENNPLLISSPSPLNVEKVDVVTQNESSITLQWNKFDDISTYRLEIGGEHINMNGTSGEPVVLVASGLTAGRRYSFTLFTVLNELYSSGYSFTAVTAPPDTERFEHITQNETSITLQWTKVEEINTYTLRYNNTEVNITHSEGSGTYTVSGLTRTTRYNFTLFTVFDYATSRGKNITAVTAPPDTGNFEHITQNETSITLQWTKVEEINTYTLRYNNTEVNITHSEGSGTYTVSGLTRTTRYNFTLFTVFDYATSRGKTITAVTAPPDTGNFEHITQNETSITLQWTKVEEINTYTLRYNNTEVNITHSEGSGTYTVSGLTRTTRYNFTLFTVFDYATSRGKNITAVTAPPDTGNFEHITQNETSITLQWTKVEEINTYTLRYNNTEVNITHSEGSGTYTVSGLTRTTRYNFTLFTVFDYATSRGKNITAVTAPPDTGNFEHITQNETSITLQWTKVEEINTYTLRYNNTEVNITHSEGSGTYTVSGLTRTTRYNFTLFTVFDYATSRGKNITAVTAPPDTGNFEHITQNETSITLQWTKVEEINTYTLRYNNTEVNITHSEGSGTYTVSGLTRTTRYNFTLFTVFDYATSRGKTITAVTAPPDTGNFEHITQNETSITLQWTKVEEINTYTLRYNNTEVNITHSEGSGTYTVSGLTRTTRYNFTLFTVFDYATSRGKNITAVTAPPDTGNFEHITQNETSITLQWTKVEEINTYTLRYNNTEVNITHSEGSGTYTVSGLTSATRYNFTLFTVFDNATSRGKTITAVTAPPDTGNFEHITQNETSITLQWTKVEEINTYTLRYNNTEVNITHSEGSGTYTVSGLTRTTRYNFTLLTVFDYAPSRGKNITAVTAPHDTERFEHITQNETSITLQWTKVEEINTYTLRYNDKEVNITHSEGSGTYTVSGLTSATRYNFTLFTVFDYAPSRGKTITAVTVPETPADFKTIGQNETSITLQWKGVTNVQEYIVSFNGLEKNFSQTTENVTHIISNLESGTRYNFRLLSVFDYARSSGANLTAPTVPPKVSSVSVTERFLDRATLELNDANKGWKYKAVVNDPDAVVNENNFKNIVSFSVTNLKPGSEYSFSVTTTFSGLNSTPHPGVIVTTIDCSSVTWHVTNSSIQGTVEGLFSKATASYESKTHISPVGKSVSFKDLHPGATYEISLEYNLSSKLLPQCSIKLPIIPPSVTARCSYWASGYGTGISWDTPCGVWTAVEVHINGKTFLVDRKESQLTVKGLQPARRYEVSFISKLVTEFGNRSSEPSFIICSTDNRGVIAGSVLGVLLFCVLIGVIVLIVLKRPDIIRRKKSLLSGSKESYSKGKIISVANFPDHFYQLSLDENRGFSLEYESLAPVGLDQTRKAATLPENTEKNRFTNILPYDWSRVKLNTSCPNDTLDYINANYIQGYNSSREYIASQGPLPSTVRDFWRMVWEQKVKRIVMVTNCIEAGRIKCEQYWPEDNKPRCYGELIISKTSEDMESNWTLREFRVKHTNDSEERTVKHFHFTAWPDHGVPQGTEVLIHFRRLVRQHIESAGSKAPTVVHCSAGVGRTGTIIALDVLLQQLEREQAVDINNFVHKMRRHRSHMVQTESQYVFLHQCIMDTLQPLAKEENIYENDDLIYVNATALRQLR